ncbi:MAG TPA: crossover junction endodeoxyribonuclease RuvC [Candidatus Paceibacterota bacterium]|nr:crossover junction endodeoxyribonuclease RuvC [Candidatus Paceibacterota bacterium]
MIILGIDPGTAITGYGIIEKGEKLEMIKYGCIKTTTDLSTAERLNKLHAELEKLIKKYKPEIVAVEDIFFFKNLKTAIKVSQARGVILLAIAQSKIRVAEYTPLQIKQAVACYGRAEKSQVQKMVKVLLDLREIPKPDDAADALAVAICCAHST